MELARRHTDIEYEYNLPHSIADDDEGFHAEAVDYVHTRPDHVVRTCAHEKTHRACSRGHK